MNAGVLWDIVSRAMIECHEAAGRVATPRQNVCACAHFGHFRFRAYVVHFHSVCFRTVRELNSQGWRSSPVREEKFTLVCSRSPKKNLKLVISRCCFAEDGKEMYHNV